MDARVLGPGFFVQLKERVDLFRHELSLDLEKAQEAVIGGVKCQFAVGFGNALHFAKERQGFGIGLHAQMGAGGNHQPCALFFTAGFRLTAAINSHDLTIVLALKGVAHEHGLSFGAEVLHAGRFQDEKKMAVGVGRAAEFGGGKRGAECGLAANFWCCVGGEHFFEKGESFLKFSIGGMKLAKRGFCLRRKVAAGRIFDDPAQRADGFTVAAQHSITISRKIISACTLLWFFRVGRVTFKHRRGKGIFATVVMIRRQRVGRGRDPFATTVAVDQRAEASPRVIDHARLVVAVAKIPPRLLGSGIVGKKVEVIAEDHRRAPIVLRAVGQIGRGLCGIVNVFSAKKQIVGGIAGEHGVDALGAGHLGNRHGVDHEREHHEASKHGNGVILCGHCLMAGAWVAKEMFQMPAFWQVSITSTMR